MHGPINIRFCQLLWRNSRGMTAIYKFRILMMNRSLFGISVFTKKTQHLCDISGMKRCTAILNCCTLSTARLPACLPTATPSEQQAAPLVTAVHSDELCNIRFALKKKRLLMIRISLSLVQFCFQNEALVRFNFSERKSGPL